jgi:hypothetical protein
MVLLQNAFDRNRIKSKDISKTCLKVARGKSAQACSAWSAEIDCSNNKIKATWSGKKCQSRSPTGRGTDFELNIKQKLTDLGEIPQKSVQQRVSRRDGKRGQASSVQGQKHRRNRNALH